MYSKRLGSLIVVVVLMSLVAGCGGGQGGGHDGGQAGDSGKSQNGTRGKGEPRKSDEKAESMTGVVGSIDLEMARFVIVKPQGEEIMYFAFDPEVLKVTLDGEEAQVEDIEQGQRADVTYFVRSARKEGGGDKVKVNIAGSLALTSREGGAGPEETTG